MKSFACSLIIGLAISVSALAGDTVGSMPYKTTTPYNDADTKKIIVLMKYDCPFCRKYHQALTYWGKSVTNGYSLEFMPVLEFDQTNKPTQKTLVPFIIYHALEKTAATPDQLEAFSDNAYAIEQDSHSVDNKQAWIKAGVSTNVPFKSIEKGLANSPTPLLIDQLKRQNHYAPEVTPTIIVCGKYKFSPEDAGGVPSVFMQLLNATLSKCMISQGVTP